MLEIVYCPVYRPHVLDTTEELENLASLPKVKYMQFTKETVKFLTNEIMVWIEIEADQQGEVLQTSTNQKKFIIKNLKKHLDIGNLQIF